MGLTGRAREPLQERPEPFSTSWLLGLWVDAKIAFWVYVGFVCCGVSGQWLRVSLGVVCRGVGGLEIAGTWCVWPRDGGLGPRHASDGALCAGVEWPSGGRLVRRIPGFRSPGLPRLNRPSTLRRLSKTAMWQLVCGGSRPWGASGCSCWLCCAASVPAPRSPFGSVTWPSCLPQGGHRARRAGPSWGRTRWGTRWSGRGLEWREHLVPRRAVCAGPCRVGPIGTGPSWCSPRGSWLGWGAESCGRGTGLLLVGESWACCACASWLSSWSWRGASWATCWWTWTSRGSWAGTPGGTGPLGTRRGFCGVASIWMTGRWASTW